MPHQIDQMQEQRGDNEHPLRWLAVIAAVVAVLVGIAVAMYARHHWPI